MTGEPALTTNARPLIAAGRLIGIGMGGFVDGIVFHQILQLHNMLSARVPTTSIPNIEVNMVCDGIFHAFVWLMTALGLAMLWRAGQKAEVPWSGRTLAGSLIQGWGIFNIVEGLLDHHFLHLHHVVERLGVSLADWSFLAVSVLLILLGGALIRGGRGDTIATHPGPAASGRTVPR
jgi:uncharacterized membrane protein